MEKMEKPVGNSPFSPFYAIGPPPGQPGKGQHFSTLKQALSRNFMQTPLNFVQILTCAVLKN